MFFSLTSLWACSPASTQLNELGSEEINPKMAEFSNTFIDSLGFVNTPCVSFEPRLHKDSNSLLRVRKEFFASEPDEWAEFYLITYINIVKEKDFSHDIDKILVQWKSDLSAQLGCESAHKWALIIPDSMKAIQQTQKGHELIAHWLPLPTDDPDSLFSMIVQLYSLTQSSHSTFDLNYWGIPLVSKIKEYQKAFGFEITQAQLKQADIYFENLKAPQPFLTQIRAHLMIIHANLDEAEALLVSLSSLTHPAIIMWNDALLKEIINHKKSETLLKTQAPDFEAQIEEGDLLGSTFKLSDYKGKVVVLSFWQSWCGPCVSKLEKLDSLYLKHKNDGLMIVGVSELNASDKKENIQKARNKYSVHYPQIYDSNESINPTFKVSSFPYIVIVGPDGTFFKVLSGDQASFAEAEIISALSLLKESAIK